MIIKKYRDLDWNQPIWVYRNLSKKYKDYRAYSVMQKGLVCFVTTSIIVENARFVIRPSGRKRVLDTGTKCVHAFIVGRPKAIDSKIKISKINSKITYNPKVDDNFRTSSGAPIFSAGRVILNEDGVTAIFD